MEHRPLGRTGLTVPVICLGTMTFGQQNTEAEGHEQMDYALAHGVNFFDTAEMYSIPPKADTHGSTERIIGSWFASRGARDKVILATKAVGRGDYVWLRENASETAQTAAQLTEAVEKSLKRLRTDYIDLYQLHWPDRRVSQWGSNPTVYKHPEAAPDENSIESILAALAGLVRSGKVRHVGLSNESAWGTMRFVQVAEAMGLPRVVSIQNAYNLLNRTFEVNLAEVAMREQVGLLAYSPLAAGFLSGKYRGGAVPPGTRKALFNRVQRYERPGAAEAIEKYWELAQAHGVALDQLAIRHATTRPFMTSVIIGATGMEHLKRDIAAATLPWTPELDAGVDGIHQIHSNPCP
jgi:aryl-alcohol dehydrogenase-like predicted oxidoreductase